MLQVTKPIRKAANRAGRNLRAAVVRALPEPVHRRIAPYVRFLDMLLLDHLFLRVVYPNRHRISSAAWRSAQPLPYQIGVLKRRGIKTVINLRGGGPRWTYHFEREACLRYGVKLVSLKLRSRAAPSRLELHAMREAFLTAEHPVLMHCKSGADRAGLAAAIYRHVIDGVPIEEAKRELSLWYGHIKHADTGVLDHFLETYIEHNRREPTAFFDWVDTHYDPDEMTRNFRASSWANRLVDDILDRE